MTIHSLSQKEVAALFGVTPRTVRDWAAQGFPRNEDGSYSGPACVAWFVSRQSGGGELDLAAERAALARAQRLKIETDEALRARDLLRADEVRQFITEHIAAARSRLLAIDGQIASELPVSVGASAAAVAKRKVYEALDELAALQTEGRADG